MEFTFKKFGKAGSGTIEINDLTIICGPNNSGKTYLNYAVFSVIREFINLFDFGFGEEDCELKEAIRQLSSEPEHAIDLGKTLLRLTKIKSDGLSKIEQSIHKYFQVHEGYFQDAEITLKLKEIDNSKKIDKFGVFIPKFINYRYLFNDDKCTLYLYNLKYNETKNGNNFFENDDNIKKLVKHIKSIIFQVHFSDIVPSPFAITAERTGAALFYKTNDDKNSSLLSGGTTEIDTKKSKLALPIVLNINDMRDYNFKEGRKSFIVRENIVPVSEILSELIDFGEYIVQDESIFFKPNPKTSQKEPIVPIHAASSSIKSFFLLDIFINQFAERGSILVIDEPELNLYIDKQVLFARLVARLVKSGIKVMVTTHNDNFFREINNLITLTNLREEYKKAIMEEYDIQECELLTQTQVNAYKTDTVKDIEKLEVSNVGVNPEEWNSIISYENKKYDKIYYAPQKDLE